VDRSAAAVLADAKSGMSVAIFDDEGDYGAVIVSGANLAIAADQLRDEWLREAKVVVLQNEIPEAVNEAAARQARRHGLTTMLNAAPARPFETQLPDFIDILVVNAIEAEMLGGGNVNSLEEALAAAATLSSRFRTVVVTAGGDGVAMCDRSGHEIGLPSVPVKVASTHGAGDAFVGTLAARLAAGDALNDALNAANQEAARLVSTPENQRVL
jgi:ribokinase